MNLGILSCCSYCLYFITVFVLFLLTISSEKLKVIFPALLYTTEAVLATYSVAHMHAILSSQSSSLNEGRETRSNGGFISGIVRDWKSP